jgi:hypothetical protein
MEGSGSDHLVAVKLLFRYVAGMQGHKLYYTRHEDGEPKLSATDLAGDLDTHKSTSSIIFFLSGNPITWQASKRKVVVLSLCESE